MISENDLVFVPQEKIKARIQINDIENSDTILQYFSFHEDEILFVENGDTVVGIYTNGDITNRDDWYKYKGLELMNRSFKSVRSNDSKKNVLDILESFPSIHIVPVVDDNRLIGVWDSGERKSEVTRNLERMGSWRTIDRRNAIKYFAKNTECQFYYYNPPLKSEIEKYFPGISKLLHQRWTEDHLKKEKGEWAHDYHTKNTWERFLGDDFERKLDCIRRANLKVKPIIENGFQYFLDYNSKTINYINGRRYTPGG